MTCPLEFYVPWNFMSLGILMTCPLEFWNFNDLSLGIWNFNDLSLGILEF